MKTKITGKIVRDMFMEVDNVGLSNGKMIPLVRDFRGQHIYNDQQALEITLILYEHEQEEQETKRIEQEKKDKFKPTGTECFTMVYPCTFNIGNLLELTLK